jgi:hypothetical protein
MEVAGASQLQHTLQDVDSNCHFGRFNWRALVEADIGRWKRVIGHAPRSQTNAGVDVSAGQPYSGGAARSDLPEAT